MSHTERTPLIDRHNESERECLQNFVYTHATQPLIPSRGDDDVVVSQESDQSLKISDSTKQPQHVSQLRLPDTASDLESGLCEEYNHGSRSHASNSLTSLVDSGSERDSSASSRSLLPVWLRSTKTLQGFLREEVPSDPLFQAQLLFLTFTTGIVDGTTLTNYNCFATKQTGNTVFLALRVARHPYVMDQEERNIVFSFIAFVTGTTLFARLGHLINQRRRRSLLLSSGIQVILVWVATALAYFVTEKDTWPIAPIIMSLLGLAAGGQIAIAIQMKQQELNTSMITGALIQLCNDSEILHFSNGARNRRVLFFCCFFLGIITGGALTMYDTPGIALVVYAIFKTLAMLSFLINPSVEDDELGKSIISRKRSRSPIFRIIWGEP
ncbi:MAG: hypothetical protein Q9159_001374 [Coniocarpon cinnabarinum]